MRPLQWILFSFGYPVSIGVISRFVPVVRHRRWRWLLSHHLAVGAIIAGWSLRRETPAIAVNSAWLVVSSLWYWKGSHLAASGTKPSGV